MVDRSAPAERLRLALDMHESGVRLMRENLRRRHPGLGEDEIEARLRVWLRTRPGAEYGDCPGTPRDPIPSR